MSNVYIRYLIFFFFFFFFFFIIFVDSKLNNFNITIASVILNYFTVVLVFNIIIDYSFVSIFSLKEEILCFLFSQEKIFYFTNESCYPAFFLIFCHLKELYIYF